MRKSWDAYFIKIAYDVSERSTCRRRQVGAVLVDENKNIISTGYNGAARGVDHCDITGCLREQLNIPSGERHEICRAIHAEQNCIIQAANKGLKIKGSTLYSTTFPCFICAKMLVNAGVKRVVYVEGYPDELTGKLFEAVNMEVLQVKEVE